MKKGEIERTAPLSRVMLRQPAVLAGLGAFVLLLCSAGYLSSGRPRSISKLQVIEVPVRRFSIRNPNDAVLPRRMRVAPFRALYSASLGADPQSFLQKAPEQGKPG